TLQAATRGAAQFVGREKELGTVETGHVADLVLLSANPVANIENSRSVWAVIRHGNYYDRAALDAMLAGAKAAAVAVPKKEL
ncbi:MAG: amidohydrolase family protein, partial [Terracidiphilus sp.]